MTEEQRIFNIAEKRVKEWIEYAKKEYNWKDAQYDLFEEPMFELCVQVATLATKELQEGLEVAETLNKSLNTMNKELEADRDKYKNMVFDLQEQIEKMKCCNNCNYRCYINWKSKCIFDESDIKDIENPITCKCNKWKLEEK